MREGENVCRRTGGWWSGHMPAVDLDRLLIAIRKAYHSFPSTGPMTLYPWRWLSNRSHDPKAGIKEDGGSRPRYCWNQIDGSGWTYIQSMI